MDSSPLQSTESSERPAENAEPLANRHSSEAVLQSLRNGLLLLGAALVFLSICFTLYVQKQNNMLTTQIHAQTRLLNQNAPIYESNQKRINAMVQELRLYAQTYPDIRPILVKYNFDKVQPQPMFTPSFPSAAPSTPER